MLDKTLLEAKGPAVRRALGICQIVGADLYLLFNNAPGNYFEVLRRLFDL